MERLGHPGMNPAGIAAPVLPGPEPAAAGAAPDLSLQHQAREELVAALSEGPDPDPMAAERMADDVLSSITGRELHLEKVPPESMRAIEGFTREGWSAIERHAAAQGAGIESLVLPLSKPICENPAMLRSFCEAASALESLTHLSIHLPDNGPVALNFGALQCSALRTLDVHVPAVKDDISGFHADITVPDGVEVRAKGTLRPSVHKSFVTWVDSKGGAVGDRRALEGATFYRQPHDFVDRHGGDLAKAAWPLVSTNNNCEAVFKARPGERQEKIVCQHLGMHWLIEQHRYLCGKSDPVRGDTKAPQRMSLSGLLDKPSIVQAVDQEKVETSLEALRAQKFLFETGFQFHQFGHAIAGEFRQMTIGGFRLFGLGVQTHFMALRLQVKEAQHGTSTSLEYIATIYDPNATATHSRTVRGSPAEFESLSLQHWTGKTGGENYLTGYYGLDSHCQIYPWPPLTTEAALSRAVAEAGPQHALVGKHVELISAEEPLLRACWDAGLRALPGGGPRHLLCVAASHGGSIGPLQGFRLYGANLPRMLPSPLAQAAFDVSDEVYFVPAEKLRESTNPKRARSSE